MTMPGSAEPVVLEGRFSRMSLAAAIDRCFTKLYPPDNDAQ
jgi:hypothetical protein